MQYKTSKMMSALLCAVVAGGLCVAFVQPSSAQTAAPVAAASTPAPSPNTVVATVDNDKILMSSVTVVLGKIKEQVPKIPQADLDSMRDQIVDDLIIERLLVNEAKRLKLMPPQQKVDDAIWQLQKPFTSRQAFLDSLKANGKTEAELRVVLAEDMAITALGKLVTKDVVITDDEATKYYNEHKTEFLVPEMVRVRHIQISVKDGAPAADREKAKKQAADLLKKATASNADFAALAKASSQDKVSAVAGGDLGLISRDDIMDKAFGDAVFSAPIGKVHAKVVDTKFGYNIIKVEEKKPSRTLALSEVSRYIKPRLLHQKYKALMDAKVAELRKTAKITNTFAKSTA